MTNRAKHERKIELARILNRPMTIIGFANNGSFQPLETYNWKGE